MNFLRRSIISLILGINLLCCNSVYAGLNVSPVTIELSTAAGDTYKGYYAVTNKTDEPVHVKVAMEDWVKAKTGKASLPPEVWLSVTPMEFDLEAGASKDVEYKINPPRGCEEELVAMVFFGTESPTGAFTLASRIGCSIYVAIKEAIRLDCVIKNITMEKSSIKIAEGLEEDKGIMFFIDVDNPGNVHIRPTGEIIITDEKDEIYNVAIERSFPVYPGQHQIYPITWKNSDVRPGSYTAKIILDYGNIYKVDKKLEKSIIFTVNEDGTVSF